MKVSSIDIDRLASAIAPLDTEGMRDSHRKSYAEGYLKCKDADTRYRWDLYWIAVHRGFSFGSDEYKDAHIDTALRRIVPSLSEA
jgi:hypothetical protein